MTAVRIRRCREDDLPALTQTAIRSWVDAYESIKPADEIAAAPARIEAALAQDWPCIFVAEAHGAIVGYVDLPEGENLIRNIYVDPAYLRRGIGRLLMEAAFDRLRDRGFSSARIDVVQGTGAPEFHKVLGWREIGRHEDAHGVLTISMTKGL